MTVTGAGCFFGNVFYAFTAPLVVEAVERVLDGRTRGSGALAPGETFDSTGFLRALAPEFLAFELSGGEALGAQSLA